MNKVFFIFKDIGSDTMLEVNGIDITAENENQPILVLDFVRDQDPLGIWWIEQGVRGYPVLVTNCPELSDMSIKANDGENNYIVTAQSNFIGGRPDDSIRK